jgi:hypothetical protein
MTCRRGRRFQKVSEVTAKRAGRPSERIAQPIGSGDVIFLAMAVRGDEGANAAHSAFGLHQTAPYAVRRNPIRPGLFRIFGAGAGTLAKELLYEVGVKYATSRVPSVQSCLLSANGGTAALH